MSLPAQHRRRTYSVGLWSEAIALTWLCLKGYRPLARRARTPVGEIDLVMRKGQTIAFVEVKARPTKEDGLSAVSPSQRARIVRAATYLTAEKPAWSACNLRFDVVIVTGRWHLPTHILNAWGANAHNW